MIWLQANEPKSGAITRAGAILIDDSFRERAEVRDRLGILTFDCSMIEIFLDERKG